MIKINTVAYAEYNRLRKRIRKYKTSRSPQLILEALKYHLAFFYDVNLPLLFVHGCKDLPTIEVWHPLENWTAEKHPFLEINGNIAKAAE